MLNETLKGILIISIWGTGVAIIASSLLHQKKSAAGTLLLLFHIIIFGLGLALNQGWNGNNPSLEDSITQNLTRFWIFLFFGVIIYFSLRNKH